MNNLTLKQKILILVAGVGALLIFIFQQGLYSLPSTSSNQSEQQTQENPDKVTAVSTDPSPLNEATIFPSQAITINFSHPAINVPELKIVFDPAVEYQAELINDKKTLTITPKTTFQLGKGYTLKIGTEAKFEGDKKLDQDLIYHFRTIEYRGV